NDGDVGEQPVHISLSEGGHHGRVEGGEGPPEPLSFAQDGEPRQPALETLQAQLFEHPAVVANRPSPLEVVVTLVLRRGGGPGASSQAVLADDDLAHRQMVPGPVAPRSMRPVRITIASAVPPRRPGPARTSGRGSGHPPPGRPTAPSRPTSA